MRDVKRVYLLVMTKTALLILCSIQRVLKSRLVKFVIRSTNERETQTEEDMDKYWNIGRRLKVPKLDKLK